MKFDEQKREAIANAKHLIKILRDVCDESPSTTGCERRFLRVAFDSIRAARVSALCILDKQDNPE